MVRREFQAFFTAVKMCSFVVHEHIVRGRITLLDIDQLLLLVDIDEHAPLNRLEEPGSFDLVRLEDHIAIRQDNRRPHLAQVLEHVQRIWEKAAGKWISQEVRRDLHEVRVVRVLDPVALESAEVIGIAQLLPEVFEDRPVAFLPLFPERLREMVPQVSDNLIVVEQRVIDVKQEYDTVIHHDFLPCALWPH